LISFGHSAFVGLGMYGAAGALLHTSPPNLWAAIFAGLFGATCVALFAAYFSSLIFSQIFYVIIFTWTAVTGGENGLIFTRPHFSIPFLVDMRFNVLTMHWFVLALVAGSYLLLRRITRMVLQ
jgi:branched-chain amino acid transport system permease protein